MKKHVVVIGGGLAGTAAAQALVGRGYEVTIVEKNDRLGGRIRSELVDGAAVEMGAGFISNAYTNVRGFLQGNGLDQQLYQQHGSSGIFRNGKVRMATLGSLIGNDTLSWGAKLHALPLILKVLTGWQQLDPQAFYRADRYDSRTVADMFASRSGKEFLEYVLQPILNGYFYWTPEHTSEAMMLVLCKAALAHSTYKMRGGLQRIPEKAAEGSTVLLGHTVKEVRRGQDGSYTVTVEHGNKRHTVQAHGIVCATTASVVPTILPDLNVRQRAFFEAVNYSATALIARTYKQKQTIGDKGIAFPRQEGVNLAAITLSPEPGADKPALATLKIYASGSIGKQLCDEPDEAIIQALTKAMEPAREVVLVGSPEPLAMHIQRWPEALPMFDVGHFRRLRTFENGENEDPSQTIVFAGDYIGGPFMEGAFTSGIRAAQRLVVRLGS